MPGAVIEVQQTSAPNGGSARGDLATMKAVVRFCMTGRGVGGSQAIAGL
jgi:hypothetical protein